MASLHLGVACHQLHFEVQSKVDGGTFTEFGTKNPASDKMSLKILGFGVEEK